MSTATPEVGAKLCRIWLDLARYWRDLYKDSFINEAILNGGPMGAAPTSRAAIDTYNLGHPCEFGVHIWKLWSPAIVRKNDVLDFLYNL